MMYLVALFKYLKDYHMKTLSFILYRSREERGLVRFQVNIMQELHGGNFKPRLND